MITTRAPILEIRPQTVVDKFRYFHAKQGWNKLHQNFYNSVIGINPKIDKYKKFVEYTFSLLFRELWVFPQSQWTVSPIVDYLILGMEYIKNLGWNIHGYYKFNFKVELITQKKHLVCLS